MPLYVLDTDTVTALQARREPVLRRNVLPFTSAAVVELASLRAQKVRIGTQDLRIASITLAVDGILVTSNRRDYDKVRGLKIEDWNQ